jgi:anhydro-N-acetylmuramic acid kinase
MSGTSADGIDVALVRFWREPNAQDKSESTPKTRSSPRDKTPHEAAPAFELIGHAHYPYPAKVRAAILEGMNSNCVSVARLARLNFLLGELYSEAVFATQQKLKLKVGLIGCHGQTLYHQGEPEKFLGRRIAATWQTGEAAVIAARVGAPVISDFRPADMAAGGKGAPLVPFLDYILFRDDHVGRIVQNIGGIANLTAIPAGAAPTDMIAFDTGPGNMVIDAVTEKLFGKAFDKNGKTAASGAVNEALLREILARPFFLKSPPKTAGREEFGREFAAGFIRKCGNVAKNNIVATATALTAKSIADAVRRHLTRKGSSKRHHRFREMIVSGGGTKNLTLMEMMRQELAALGIVLRFSDEFGLPSEAKEAVAFALLAHETWHRRPSNIASATGAKRPAVLGKSSYP